MNRLNAYEYQISSHDILSYPFIDIKFSPYSYFAADTNISFVVTYE
jgi:hypothetical protein